MKLIECVPNFSEGRDRDVIDAITREVTATPGAVLLDVDHFHSMMDAIESMEASPDNRADMDLIEHLIASESRKRKKSIRYFGLRGKELD